MGKQKKMRKQGTLIEKYRTMPQGHVSLLAAGTPAGVKNCLLVCLIAWLLAWLLACLLVC